MLLTRVLLLLFSSAAALSRAFSAGNSRDLTSRENAVANVTNSVGGGLPRGQRPAGAAIPEHLLRHTKGLGG
jgi:hypothetical protein